MLEHQNDDGEHVQSFPFIMFSETSFASITLGIGLHFLDEVNDLLEKNKQNWKKGPIDRYSLLKDKLGKAKERWQRANQKFYEILNKAWESHIQSGEVAEDLQKQFTIVAKRCAATSIHCATNLFRHMGMQAVMQSSTINLIWRDLYTAGQHMFLTPNNDMESQTY